MSIGIDTTFDVYSDARGRDPDSHSPTLRRYHKILWSKPLPDGTCFDLSNERPGDYLHHKSQRGEFILSSDSLGHTYRYVKAMAGIITQVPDRDLDKFFSICSTPGAYIVFPARKIEGKTTINAARGLNSKIRDRFDLTLECIRLHYLNEESPLSLVLLRYADFFVLFNDFQGYVDFFLLQDLISEDGASIHFFLPFKGFDHPPLPSDVDAYLAYRDNMIAFVTARNRRITKQE
ncbi:DUF6994 family protein [Cypionkella sp. TWP1-2-1b2]|uniref:DUF6994 family protein n=1 Tax=Cypionkella sp. TWP1-2-1b2 TaxID=2804675 RepID=UPI003CF11B18